jgi:hypothetical protein
MPASRQWLPEDDPPKRSYLAADCAEETKLLAWANSARPEFSPLWVDFSSAT